MRSLRERGSGSEKSEEESEKRKGEGREWYWEEEKQVRRVRKTEEKEAWGEAIRSLYSYQVCK